MRPAAKLLVLTILPFLRSSNGLLGPYGLRKSCGAKARLIATQKKKARCALQKKKARFLRPPSPLKTGFLLTAPILAPLVPAAGFLGVMGAPIYGKNLLPGTGGLIDFKTLEKTQGTTNEYLARANSDECPSFGGQELETGGGGGGGAAVGSAPIYPGVSATDLENLFREVLTGLYVIPAYALPTLSNPKDKQYVFVQRTPLLRFPDVINVRFLEVTDVGVEAGAAAGAGSSLLVHSKSVFGIDDLGTNRKRVLDLLARLDDAVDAWRKKRPSGATLASEEAAGLTEPEKAVAKFEGVVGTAASVVDEAIDAAAGTVEGAAEAAAELSDEDIPVTKGGAAKGMNKAETDAYIASVKADVDKIARARSSGSEEGKV